MRNTRALFTLGGSAVLALGTTSLFLAPASAQVRPSSVACSQTALVAAVNAANAAGGGTVTLTPGCTYTLTSANGDDGVNGPDGLPIITTPITFSGNANVIARAATAPAFRVVQVSSTGGVTLDAVTISGGDAASVLNHNGGGILSFGAITLTGSHLSGNTAAGLGGAVYSTGTAAAATFTSSTVTGNTAARGAGLASVAGALTITSSSVTGNAATVDPGGIYFDTGTATLHTSTVTANTPTNCVGSPSPVPGCVG